MKIGWINWLSVFTNLVFFIEEFRYNDTSKIFRLEYLFISQEMFYNIDYYNIDYIKHFPFGIQHRDPWGICSDGIQAAAIQCGIPLFI